MYIPSHLRAAAVAQDRLGPAAHPDTPPSQSASLSLLYHLLRPKPFRSCDAVDQKEQGILDKRQFSDNPSKNTDIKIGLVVGILLAAFIAAIAAFLFIYGRSIRFTKRRKRRRHRHIYYSSKSSRSSDGAPPPRPPPQSEPSPPVPPPVAKEGPPPKDG
ncbi:hypothetical protein B0T10DRAFT_481923 [Thelonectria olida]|uniref:Uncharacterized protein n=1 Tax=Thelonectria olida TaxID=1576542 RepID=A0A9P9ASC5_9HYPO|nr:hypothetical protein B0T10DRAFT_481923 [Thelonectria olida]